jgi:transcriptional regulator with XRE-family HTH domain
MTGRDLYILIYDAGISQKELATKLGVSKAQVSRWVKGIRKISPGREEQIRQALQSNLPQEAPHEVLTA